MKNDFLLIGPRYLIENSNRVGGIVVLFEDLITYCDENQIKYLVVDTNKKNYTSKSFAYILIIYYIITKIPQVKQVSLHGTANDFLWIAPFALFISKVFAKKFSLRKFAGNFIEIYENYSGFKKWVITNTLKYSSVNFFETKYLVHYFEKYNKNTYWFPNVRKKQNEHTSNAYRKKFIFIGAVSFEKGIEVLCNASNYLNNNYQIDIYGTLYDNYDKKYFNNYKVTYKGELKPSKVIKTLSEYDVLILPSYREGYPGVIIEALSIGLPIVATNLDGIKEMINTDSAVFIDIGNEKQLEEAIKSFNENNYLKMSKASLAQFQKFDSSVQTRLFFERVNNVKP